MSRPLWHPMQSLLRAGTYMLAWYAPTSWAYSIRSVKLEKDEPERVREIKTRYARAWARMPDEPHEDIE